MILSTDDYIKHKRNKDVCYKILGKYYYSTDGSIKIKAMIYNMGFKDSYNLGVKCKIRIYPEDVHNWEQCCKYTTQCLRYADWRPLKTRAI